MADGGSLDWQEVSPSSRAAEVHSPAMNEPLDELLALYHVLLATDNPFQTQARLPQALWREEQGVPIGEHRGRLLGSLARDRVPMTTSLRYSQGQHANTTPAGVYEAPTQASGTSW